MINRMKYKYEIELYGEEPYGGSILTLLSDEELTLCKNSDGLINEFGYIVLDTNGETIISFGKDLYHEG